MTPIFGGEDHYGYAAGFFRYIRGMFISYHHLNETRVRFETGVRDGCRELQEKEE
jgi:hypothetical protein